MLIGGLAKCSLVDVPGKIAATLFTIGCPFRCTYCHNPELVIPAQYAKPIPLETIFSFLQSRIGKLEAICISGGEPTLHPDLGSFIERIKDLGYFVKLDTMGIFPDRVEALLATRNVGYVAMDIKAPIDRYDQIINVKNVERSIERSINLLMNSGIDYEFRTTVAKPLLSVADFDSIGPLIRGAKRYFIQNYVKPPKQVDPTVSLASLSQDELLQAQEIMQQYVNCVEIR